MHKAWLSLVVASGLLLAGCIDPEKEGERALDERGAASESAAAPEWRIGQFWTYSIPEGQATLVVVGEEGGDWIVATTDGEMAYYDALYDVSYLGAVRKSDLAGSQGGDRVQFFQFPLEDGKEWTTRWDGFSLKVTATESAPGIYDLVGMDGNRKHVEYTYNAEKGFFQRATWFGGEGFDDWGLELTASGQNFRGTIQSYRIGALHTFENGFGDSMAREVFEIDAGWNEIGLRGSMHCNDDAAGQLLLGVNGPEFSGNPLPMSPVVNPPEEGHVLDCADAQEWDSAWVMANPGGAWEVGIIVGSPNGQVSLFMEERAREETAFP
jgi:hypothetical protein